MVVRRLVGSYYRRPAMALATSGARALYCRPWATARDIRIGDVTVTLDLDSAEETPGTRNHELWRASTYETKEPDTMDWIRTHVRDGVLYDVGANIGQYSLYAAKLRAEPLEVLAFEPEALNHAKLVRNIVHNGLSGSGAAVLHGRLRLHASRPVLHEDLRARGRAPRVRPARDAGGGRLRAAERAGHALREPRRPHGTLRRPLPHAHQDRRGRHRGGDRLGRRADPRRPAPPERARRGVPLSAARPSASASASSGRASGS